MSCLCGLDCDLGGFKITNLTDHNHVGILSKKGFQCSGKGEPHTRIDVNLIDAGEIDFGRIFGG